MMRKRVAVWLGILYASSQLKAYAMLCNQVGIDAMRAGRATGSAALYAIHTTNYNAGKTYVF